MQSSTNSKKDIEKEVADFEKLLGPLSEKYPYTFPIRYSRSNEPYCHYSQSLQLDPNGTYKALLSLGGEDSYSTYVQFTAEGKFTYDVQKRTLILEELSRVKESCYDCFQEICDKTPIIKDILDKHFPRRLEIPNFTWISPTLQWPWIRLVKPSPESNYTDIDFKNYYVEMCEIEAKYNGFPEFSRVLDQVETANLGVQFANSISEPVKYEDLTLNPDGTFAYDYSTSSWDRDGCYTWDSYFKYSGKWEYDADKRIMKLNYESFKINDDGKDFDPNKFKLQVGRVDETKNFYFESNYIYAVDCRFDYGTPCAAQSKYLEKKKK